MFVIYNFIKKVVTKTSFGVIIANVCGKKPNFAERMIACEGK